MYYIGAIAFGYEEHLAHHGIKGQKWGIRRYQNPDGTLTEEGKKRYNGRTNDKDFNDFMEWEKAYASGKTTELYEPPYEKRLRERLGNKVVDDWVSKSGYSDIVAKSYDLVEDQFDMYDKYTGKGAKSWKAAKSKYLEDTDKINKIQDQIKEETDALMKNQNVFKKVMALINEHDNREYYKYWQQGTEKILQKNGLDRQDLDKMYKQKIDSEEKMYTVARRIQGYLKNASMAEIISTVPDDLKEDAWFYLRDNWDYD